MSKKQTWEIEGFSGKLDELVTETLQRLNWRYEQKSTTEFHATLGPSLMSWGERIRVRNLGRNEVEVRSKLFFGLTSWGKHRMNLQAFGEMLTQVVAEYTAIKQESFRKAQEAKNTGRLIKFTDSMVKLYHLYIEEELNTEEYYRAKQREIEKLVMIECESSREQFLETVVQLLEGSIINKSEVNMIKTRVENEY